MSFRPGASVLRGGRSRSLPGATTRTTACSACIRAATSTQTRTASSFSCLDVRIRTQRRGGAASRTTRQYHSSGRKPAAWSAALSVASNVVGTALSRATGKVGSDIPGVLPGMASSIDPLRIVASEMKFLTGNIRKLLGSGHPSLDRVAKYYTQAEGKHVRPLIVLLMSRATSLCPRAAAAARDLGVSGGAGDGPLPRQHVAATTTSPPIDSSLSPLPILADFNPSAPSSSSPPPSGMSFFASPNPLTAPDALDAAIATNKNSNASASPSPAETAATPAHEDDILPSQRRLAEITELIHTASLLHDDVIDHSESRRGAPSANLAFGNKMAVLGGDFLLGRASVALARLRNAEVVELLATVIANLVEGEFMQLKNTSRDERRPRWSEDALAYYLQKTYLKTASLISKSCRAAALLGGADARTVDAAYEYGKNLGLAFQLVDDLLDYTRSADDLGKPAGADLELGLATAPLLFAWKTMPELGSLVGRKFEGEGDVERARELVLRSDGIEQTRALAREYSENAIAAIRDFPDSEAKDGLVEMAVKTLKRQK